MRHGLRYLMFLVCAVASAQTSSQLGFGLLTSESGAVSIVRSGRERSVSLAAADTPTVVVDGDQLTNDGESSIVVSLYPGRQQLVLSGGSTVVFSRTAEAAVRVEYGRALVLVAPDGGSAALSLPGTSFARTTGSASAEVFITSSGALIERYLSVSGETVVTLGARALVLNAGETLDLVDSQAQPTDPGVTAFWRDHLPEGAPATDVLLNDVARLEDTLIGTLGVVPDYLIPEPVLIDEPDPPVVEQTPPAVTAEPEAPAVTPVQPERETVGAEPAVDALFAEPRVTGAGLSTDLLATIGSVLVGSSALANSAALGYSWFGGPISGGTQLSREGVTEILLWSGGGMLAGGLLFYALALVAGN